MVQSGGVQTMEAPFSQTHLGQGLSSNNKNEQEGYDQDFFFFLRKKLHREVRPFQTQLSGHFKTIF